MEDLSKLKKSELIRRIEELELNNITLWAEVTILRGLRKKAKKPSTFKGWRGICEGRGDNKPYPA